MFPCGNKGWKKNFNFKNATQFCVAFFFIDTKLIFDSIKSELEHSTIFFTIKINNHAWYF